MDPLTRFKSVGRRAPSSAAQLQSDLAAEARRDTALHSVTVRAWPPKAPADDDEEWDALIWRAKMQAAALPTVPRPPRSVPAQHLPPELQVTPPPVLVGQAPAVSMGKLHTQRIRTAEEVRAKLDVIVRGGVKRSTVLPPRR